MRIQDDPEIREQAKKDILEDGKEYSEWIKMNRPITQEDEDAGSVSNDGFYEVDRYKFTKDDFVIDITRDIVRNN